MLGPRFFKILYSLHASNPRAVLLSNHDRTDALTPQKEIGQILAMCKGESVVVSATVSTALLLIRPRQASDKRSARRSTFDVRHDPTTAPQPPRVCRKRSTVSAHPRCYLLFPSNEYKRLPESARWWLSFKSTINFIFLIPSLINNFSNLIQFRIFIILRADVHYFLFADFLQFLRT